MSYAALFRMPTPVKITGRYSSITNSFINSIIPVVKPSEEQIAEALSVLGMSKENFTCAYCGDKPTEWDHLRPLVRNGKPTGYISEIHNLVPSCGKCNQSKGNKNWKDWMLSKARLSPTSRQSPDIAGRILRLEAYEKWGTACHMNFAEIVGEDLWDAHWNNWQRIRDAMKDAQVTAGQINLLIAKAHSAL